MPAAGVHDFASQILTHPWPLPQGGESFFRVERVLIFLHAAGELFCVANKRTAGVKPP